MPQTRTYRTNDKFDIERYGRVTRRSLTRIRITQHLHGPAEVVLRWTGFRSESSFTEGIEFPPDETDSHRNQFGVMLRARWPSSRR